MYYTYSQNNSGGFFDLDPEKGISTYVIVEAASAEEADERAEKIGLYFDSDFDLDCSCCGSRWIPLAGYGFGEDEPMIYGTPAKEYKHLIEWAGENPETYIHHLDGRIEHV